MKYVINYSSTPPHSSPWRRKWFIYTLNLEWFGNDEGMSGVRFRYASYHYVTSFSIWAPNPIYVDLKYDHKVRSYVDSTNNTISSH